MRRHGIIHSQLAAVLAGLRHTDTLVIADSGLPVPRGPEVVDLGFVYGAPTFESVLSAVLAEIVVEASTAAEEIAMSNPACFELLVRLLPDASPRMVPHEEFKLMVAGARCVVRTGEATPYANVLLRCGVPFA